MSRIFDALRQSERDKQPDADRWLPVIEKAAVEPGLSGGDENAREPKPPSDENPLGLAPLPTVAPEAAKEATLRSSMAPVRTASGVPAFEFDNPMAGVLPEGFTFQPAQPLVARDSVQIDMSKLKVVPVESVQAPTLVALNAERELGAEKFRVLGTRLSNIRLGANIGILQVTSSVLGEGKSLISVNLSMTLAKRFAQKVLLIEGDLRKPAACALLGLHHQMGIGEWWQEQETPISDFILRIGETGMCVLPAGNVAHPASVLQSPKTADMIADVARQFDWVIIDTPPLLPMADSNLWSRISDGTLMVVRKGAVSRSALKKAVDSIDNPKLVGIVLNDASDYDQVNYYGQYNMPPEDEVANALRKAISR